MISLELMSFWSTASESEDIGGNMKDTLIFFDINGTLIKRDSRTDLPFTFAIEALFEQIGLMEDVNTSARSDRDVFIEVLGKVGQHYSEGLWARFLALYEDQLELFKESDVWRENADAIWYVKSLVEKGYALSLITGELSIGAAYKLKKLGIWQYFSTGGFGEDGLKRFEIAEAALKKAKYFYCRDFEKLVVIGDTVLDIKTARHIGAKVISIATGSNTIEELQTEGPDELVEWFREVRSLNGGD